MEFFTTGVESVDQVGKMNISGNVVPAIWHETILNEKGKPAFLSIYILSEVVYWHRPMEVRNEQTGTVIGWKKRFKGDMLQRGYKEWMDKFGESRKTVQRALDLLCELGVIRKHFRTVRYTNGMILNNVMFIELVPEVLYRLTYPETENISDNYQFVDDTDYEIIAEEDTENQEITAPSTPMVKNDHKVWSKMTTGYGQICPEGVVKNDHRVETKMTIGYGQICPEGLVKNDHTNTENTTETNILSNNERIYTNPSIRKSISQSIDLETEKVSYRDVIANNISLGLLKDFARGYKGMDRMVDDIYGLICEIVEIKHKSIRINNSQYPYEHVKERFLMLRYTNIVAVLERFMKETGNITNVRGYWLTALYNESYTVY